MTGTSSAALGGEDPRDRRRRTAAIVCVALAGGATGIVIGAANRQNLGQHAIALAINGAAIAALWALITLSTSAAVKQLTETILVRIREIGVDAQDRRVAAMRAIVDDAFDHGLEQIRKEIRTQVAEPDRVIAGRLGRIQDRLGMRADDDPTVPLSPRTIAAVAAVPPDAATVDRLAGRLLQLLDQRIDERLSGVEALAKNERMLNVVGWPVNPRR